ncbi:MAG: alpha/beta hydrolase [Deltaproteobacteria bacterium]|nr:alpha/beta hydrolase [Deltaproteobacteria bacterium]
MGARGSISTIALLSVWSLLFLGGCNSLFFQPDSHRYFKPEQFGLWHEEFRIPGPAGDELHGWHLPARGVQKGTVIHFHGNGANITNHLYSVRWLPYSGYSVFMFDYRGYGESPGGPSRQGLIDDGAALIEYVRSLPQGTPGRIIVYGQSLGGAIAVASLAQAGTKDISGLVLEGAFHSYREVVRLILGRSWITWTFQYPVAYLLFNDDYRPLDYLPHIKDMSLLVVHGGKDRTVPIETGRKLYEGFPGEHKRFWEVPGADHLGIFSPENSPWREGLLEWMDEQVGPLNIPGYRWEPRRPRWSPPPPHPRGTMAPPD